MCVCLCLCAWLSGDDEEARELKRQRMTPFKSCFSLSPTSLLILHGVDCNSCLSLARGEGTQGTLRDTRYVIVKGRRNTID